MKIPVIWYVAPRGIVEADRRFRGSYSFLHHGDEGRRALLLVAVIASEMSVNIYDTTHRYNPEDNHLYPHTIYCDFVP